MLLNGKDLMIFVDGKAIAYAKSCEIDVKANSISTSTKDSGIWNENVVDSLGYTVSTDGLCSLKKDTETGHVYDELFKKLVEHQPVVITYGLPKNPSSDGVPEGGWQVPTGESAEPATYSGKALIDDLKISGAKGDMASMSISLTGTGPLKPLKAS